MIVAKIDALTKEQTALFPEYIDRWTHIGLSTEPANRPAAEEGVRQAYAVAGLPPPRIVWCSSPLAMALTRAVVQKLPDAAPGDSVGDSLWDSVGASVWASVGASVRASVWASVWDSGYGQHDANWIGFYGYFRDALGLTAQTDKLNGLRLLTENAGWYLPHEYICWISERTSVVHQDSRHRLHCETGPALSYPDGWSLYRWHGVEVPGWVIERPDTITLEAIRTEQNAEVRRVMLLKYGLDRYLTDTDAVAIDRDHDLHGPRTLYRMQDAMGPIAVVRLTNSTPEPDGSRKLYTFRVPPDTKTCRAAVAYMYGLHPTVYAPVAES